MAEMEGKTSLYVKISGDKSELSRARLKQKLNIDYLLISTVLMYFSIIMRYYFSTKSKLSRGELAGGRMRVRPLVIQYLVWQCRGLRPIAVSQASM